MRKLFSSFLLLFLFLFAPSTADAFTHKEGDIIVSRSTSSSGLTGHAGLVIANGTKVMHIRGYGYKPEWLYTADWYKRYPSAKIVRPNNATDGKNAARWAYNYYITGSGKNTSYGISTNPRDRTVTYCSEIAWQGYYYGAGKEFKQGFPSQNGMYYTFRVPPIIEPYNFVNNVNLSHNNFRIVRTSNW